MLGSNPELAMVQQIKSSCLPIKGIAQITAEYPFAWSKECIAHNERVLEWLKDQPDVEYVVISSVLSLLRANLVSVSGAVEPDDRLDFVLQQMQETVAVITAMGKRPVFISPTPQLSYNMGECLRSMALFGDSDDICDFTLSEYLEKTVLLQDFLNRLGAIVPVVMLADYMCHNGICDAKAGSVNIYTKGGHLSVNGSSLLGQQMDFTALIKARADAFYGSADG